MTSEELYEYLLNGFRSRFDWLRLSDGDVPSSVTGLPTVLMDNVINCQFIEEFNKAPEPQDKWTNFFNFLEELLASNDALLIDAIDTTILEMIAADHDVKLEQVLPYCGARTRRSIYGSVSNYYGKPQKAEELMKQYPVSDFAKSFLKRFNSFPAGN